VRRLEVLSWLWALLLVSAGTWATSPAAAAPPEPGEILASIEKATNWLLSEQKADGSWQSGIRSAETQVGASSLALLALLNAGVPPEAAAMQRALDWLRTQQPSDTYSVSLQTMALSAVGNPRDLVFL